MKRFIIVLISIMILLGCSFSKPKEKGVDMKKLETKPVWQMTPQEIDKFVGEMRIKYPKLGDRVAAIARRNLGQQYKLYLLGEFPFEIYDKENLLSIDKGDCVVFSEHMYAMSLAYDWQSFFTFLQRIRYKSGEISVLTRNHYTISDWDRNNAWLVKDMSTELAGSKAQKVTENIDRKKFFKERYKMDTDFQKESYTSDFIPAEEIPNIADKLQNGDFVNIIRGTNPNDLYAGHVGLITVSEDGTVNFLHSVEPVSVENPLIPYVKKQIELNKERKKDKKVQFMGIKILRLCDDAIDNLKKIDGPDAPVVTGPKGLIRKMPEKYNTK